MLKMSELVSRGEKDRVVQSVDGGPDCQIELDDVTVGTVRAKLDGLDKGRRVQERKMADWGPMSDKRPRR